MTGPDRYDPEINATYAEMARHYGVAIVPARPRKPKDKAKVEAGVLLAQRWILACLRNRQFFSLEELNEAIAELHVVGLNKPRKIEQPGEPLTGARRAVQCAYLFLGFDGPSTTTDDSGLWPARSLASRSL